MTDKETAAENVWRFVATKAATQGTFIEYGDGRAMIGVAHNGSVVRVNFYDANGFEKPQVIGETMSGEEAETVADKVKPRAAMQFTNRESLQVLINIAERGLRYFDEIDAAKSESSE